MTDNDRKLLDALAVLNAASATFSTELFTGELDREAHVRMALLLLEVVDRVLKRMVDTPEAGQGDDT